MTLKILRPAPLLMIQGGRAGDCGDPGRTSNVHLTKNVPSMREATSPTVLAYIFAANGGVGYLVPNCPFCAYEHIHGPYRSAGFVANMQRWNGHVSHCHTRREWDGESGGHYLFVVGAPAMLVPGQERGRRARWFLEALEEQGCSVSWTVTLPSEKDERWWLKRRGIPAARNSK